jgi:hypothetical protein
MENNMNFELRKFKPLKARDGFIATTDVDLECGVQLRGLLLKRPREAPNVAWLHIPTMAQTQRQTVGISPDLRAAIGRRAVAVYEAMTGAALEFSPPKGAAESDEPEDAGLRRVIGETMEIAGL